MLIPEDVASIPDNDGEIPKGVAEIGQTLESPEITPYVISFAKYNEDVCEIPLLEKNKGRKAIFILKEIGTKVYTRADFQRNNIPTKIVEDKGGYKPLYNRIDDGIEIREMFLQDTGRIFYFDIEPERILYVVAITQNHLETDQVRR